MPSLDEIFGATTPSSSGPKASLDDIFGADVPRGTLTPQQAFLEAKPGSPERIGALDALQQEQVKKDRAESLAAPAARPQLPEVDSGIPDPTNLAVKAINAMMPEGLPQGMAMAATSLGGAASKIPGLGKLVAPVNVALSAAGGAAGVEADEALRRAAGLPEPPPGEVAQRVEDEALKQGGAQLAGEAMLGGLRGMAGSGATAATRRAAGDVKEILSTQGTKLAAGESAQGLIEDLKDRSQEWVNSRYEAAERMTGPNDLVKPRHLESALRKWEKEVKKGYAGQSDLGEIEMIRDRLKDPNANKLDAPDAGLLHFSSIDKIRKDLNAKAYKPSLPGLPGPSTAMMRELSYAAARDMESVPNELVRDLSAEAREAYKLYEAPFKVDKARSLYKLLDRSPEDISKHLESPRAAQTIRELKAVADLHPEMDTAARFQELRQNMTRSIIEGSKIAGAMGDRVSWSQVYGKTRKMAEALDAAHEPGYAADLKALSRRMLAAESVTKYGSYALGGAMLWHHPTVGGALAAAPVIIGANAVEHMLGTRAGVRLLAEGALPRTAQVLGSQAARTAAGVGVRAFGNDPVSQERTQEIEQQLPPMVTAQIKAQMPGPNGEPPAANIGGVKTPIDPLIAVTAQEHGVSPQLVKAMIHAESGGDQRAVSPKGAIGLMQLMPATAKQMGVNPSDPVENIQGGTKYMASLLQRYDGDKAKALAAYNAGPTAVDKYGGVPPYKETQDYVKKVLEREQKLSAPKPLERLASLLSTSVEAAVPPPSLPPMPQPEMPQPQPGPQPTPMPTPGPQGPPPPQPGPPMAPAPPPPPQIAPPPVAVAKSEDPVLAKASTLGHRNARMNFYADVIQRAGPNLPPEASAQIREIYSGKGTPYEKAQGIASLLVQKGVVSLDDQGKPTRSATWPEIAQRFMKAKKSGDEDEWKSVRKLINQRIKSKIQDPNLGMHPNDYRRFLPMISEALKPDEEPVSVAARG
jgi:hypothetical protein